MTDHRAFVKRALKRTHVPLSTILAYPAAGALRLKDAVQTRGLPAAAAYTIEATDRFDVRFDAFWDELLRHNPETLLADRSSSSLAWHFGAPLRRGRVWIFTAARDRRLRGYCILKREDDGRGLPRMRLVDYQALEPEIDLLPALVRAALRRCADERISILEHFGPGVPAMRAFDASAPYRRKLMNWQCFYRAVDETLVGALANRGTGCRPRSTATQAWLNPPSSSSRRAPASPRAPGARRAPRRAAPWPDDRDLPAAPQHGAIGVAGFDRSAVRARP